MIYNYLNKKLKNIFLLIVLTISLFSVSSNAVLIKNNISKISNQEISGLYFLRDDDIGQPINDEGTLKKETPKDNESTFCGMYILFHFAEEGTYLEKNTIDNIYFHVWQKTPEYDFEGWEFDLGYCNQANHNWYMNESVHINTSECISVFDNYRLVQTMLYSNQELATFEGDEIYNFTIKSMGNCPRIRNNPNQYSFVMLNLEDNNTLINFDRDDDLLNDFDELYKYFTNPFDYDTDKDGATDFEEVSAEDYGYNNSDPNNPFDTTDYKNLPIIKITKPVNYIYIKNMKFVPFFIPLLFGKTDITAVQINNLSNITKVEFYVDDVLQYSVKNPPYMWRWDELSFFKHEIKAVAYDSFGNYNFDKIIAWRIG